MLIESGWYCHTHVHAILVYKLTVSIFYSVHNHCAQWRVLKMNSALFYNSNFYPSNYSKFGKGVQHQCQQILSSSSLWTFSQSHYRGESPKFSHCSQWRKNRMEISGPFRLSAISSPLRFKCTSYYSKSSFFCRREPQDCPSLISGNAELAKVTNLKLWRKWNYCRDDFLNLSAEL